MSERGGKILLTLELLLLLLPLTLVTALILMLSYPAYPIPNLRPLTIAFDLAMLLQIAGIAAAWRLAAGYLRRGPAGVQRAHPVWHPLLAASALMGILGAGVAIEHMFTPRTAADQVGFALLAPAAALAPLAVHLRRRRSRLP